MPLRVLLAQINTLVGDLEGNRRRIEGALERARKGGADLVVFPELTLTGYPPEDLLLRPGFVEANLQALEDLLPATRGLTALVGFVDRKDDLYNAAALLHDGRVVTVYHKRYLPNYSVFDEDRYFQVGTVPGLVRLGETWIGISICEDIWYPGGPAEEQALLGGAEVLINLSASPYHRGKPRERERMLATRAADATAFVLFCNLVGGQDELVFDGGSLAFDPAGRLLARAPLFREADLWVEVEPRDAFRRRLHDPRRRKERFYRIQEGLPPEGPQVPLGAGGGDPKPPLPEGTSAAWPTLEEEEVYQALVLGTRDYVRKNGFETAVIGLSGGIDSSLTATIAVDALGSERVVGVRMPSRYSSRASLEDAEALARNLGIRLLTLSIEGPFQAYLDVLAEVFGDLPPDVTEENIQARIRGNYLMALSNKFGWLVLTTGNKSEMAVGYATLYGDMAGGFAVIKDLPKMWVYRLARWRNRVSPVIPERVLTKPPSAELRPDQKDEDSLPPYAVLDPILEAYVEEDRSFDEIVAMGFDPDTVARVIRMVDRSEYKRRQAPPGVRISPRAFGKDRRLPITNAFRDGRP